jgi:hypothetical protein
MKAALVLIVCLSLSACSSAVIKCGETCSVSTPGAEAFQSIADGAELASSLRKVLVALSECNAESPALVASGLMDPHTSGQWPVTHALQCFSVIRWTDEGTFIAFYLGRLHRSGSIGPAEFMMTAAYDGEQWRFTWPADLGPSNLGRE